MIYCNVQCKKYASIKRKYGSNCNSEKRKKRNLYPIYNNRTECCICGFKPTHLCQMDIDHIDGNRHNNSDNNLQVLCANCHRLKTYMNKDWQGRY